LAYIDQYNAAAQTDFQHRVAVAIVNYVKTVVAEPNTTGNHPNRVGLMRAALADLDSWAERFAKGMPAMGADATAAATDAQLLTWVGQMWDAFAGTV
jgi:hypothetical protein